MGPEEYQCCLTWSEKVTAGLADSKERSQSKVESAISEGEGLSTFAEGRETASSGDVNT